MAAASMDMDVCMADTHPTTKHGVVAPCTPVRVEAQAEETPQPPKAPRKLLIGRSRLLQHERREGEHQTSSSSDNASNGDLSIYPDYYDGPVRDASIIAHSAISNLNCG